MNLFLKLGIDLKFILENSLDIDAFSEEFDLRMRFGRGPSSTCSTIPRPTFAGPPQPPPPRPGSAAPIQIIHSHRDYVDGPHRHNDPMSQSQISDNTGWCSQIFSIK